jgi:hypothetical protein
MDEPGDGLIRATYSRFEGLPCLGEKVTRCPRPALGLVAPLRYI